MDDAVQPSTFRLPEYEVGEEVLAHHGICIYPAKIVDVEPSEEVPDDYLYNVHYFRWHKSWDEWVPASRLMKKTSASLAQAEAVRYQLRDVDTKDHRKKSLAAATTTRRRRKGRPRGRRAKARLSEVAKKWNDMADDADPGRVLPPNVRAALIADWQAICQERSLAPLPARPNINAILDSYVWSKSIVRTPSEQKDVMEVTSVLRSYFELVLEKRLLYDVERPQLADVLAPPATEDRSLTAIYGVQHLLRLLVLFFSWIDNPSKDPAQRQKIIQKLSPLLTFLSRHLSSMAPNEYLPMSPNYVAQIQRSVGEDGDQRQPDRLDDAMPL